MIEEAFTDTQIKLRRRVPLDKSEGVVKRHLFAAMLAAPRGSQRVEGEDSGNLTVNHFPVKPIVSPTIDTA
jgi:hypothetical protein